MIARTGKAGNSGATGLQNLGRRAAGATLRGGLTTWVHVGMMVRRLRGRTDPLDGLGQRETFEALCRLVEANADARPLADTDSLAADAHVRVFSTEVMATAAIARIESVLRPYAAAGSVTRSGPAVIGWFAIRHLIATRGSAYALQVVHLTPDAGPCQLSLMLPRSAAEPAPTEHASARPESGLRPYLDAYCAHFSRELLLIGLDDPRAASPVTWASEPSADGGVAVAATLSGSVTDRAVLTHAVGAVTRLGDQFPQVAGIRLGEPALEGDLVVQRWAVGPGGGYVLSVAARTGTRRRATQVVVHVALAPGRGAGSRRELTPAAGLDLGRRRAPRQGPASDQARALTVLPLWWHSASARYDGNDVILYEMPFRGQLLRIRANDYPAEPLYTLLVGKPGAEEAAVDLEHWPTAWIRPRST